MRVPTVFWLPEKISPGIINQIGSAMDLFHTLSKLVGVPIPNDRIIDSYDLSPTLFKNQKSSRDFIFYYRGTQLYALRLGEFKAHFITQGEYGEFGEKIIHNPPLLYNLSHDPAEKYNIIDKHPEIIEKIKALAKKHKDKMVIGKDLLRKRG